MPDFCGTGQKLQGTMLNSSQSNVNNQNVQSAQHKPSKCTVGPTQTIKMYSRPNTNHQNVQSAQHKPSKCTVGEKSSNFTSVSDPYSLNPESGSSQKSQSGSKLFLTTSEKKFIIS